MTTVAFRMVGNGRNDWAAEVDLHEIDLAPTFRDPRRLAQLHRQARRLSLKLSKSRWHQPYTLNRGGLVLLDDRDVIVARDGYSLDVTSTERILSVMADQAPPSMPRSVERLR